MKAITARKAAARYFLSKTNTTALLRVLPSIPRKVTQKINPSITFTFSTS